MAYGIVRMAAMVAVVASVASAEVAPPAPKTSPARETAPARATAPARSREMTATVAGSKVNINTASVNELMTLNGVGRKLAEKIVEYRDAHGHFKTATEIRKVKGFGGSLWTRNRARVVVE